MIRKSVVLFGCLAGVAIAGSPAMSAPRHGSKPMLGAHRIAAGTAHVSANHPRHSGNWRWAGHSRHFRHHHGTSFVFFGGYPFYPYYPYWNGYWDSYPYGYYYYGGRPAYGYDDSLVAEVQRRLGEQGYYNGAIDGVVGPRTRSAIRAYERRHGLRVDGVIDRQLLGYLRVE